MLPLLLMSSSSMKRPSAASARDMLASTPRTSSATLYARRSSCSSEHAEDLADLLAAVLRAQGAAQQSHARGRRRRPGEIDVQTAVEERLPHRRSGLEIGHQDGDDRGLRLVGAEAEPQLPQARVEALAVLPQMGALVG